MIFCFIGDLEKDLHGVFFACIIYKKIECSNGGAFILSNLHLGFLIPDLSVILFCFYCSHVNLAYLSHSDFKKKYFVFR